MANNQAQQQALALQQQANANGKFMALSIEQPIKTIAQGGNAYVQGQSLHFQTPFVPGGWATGFKIHLKVKFNAALNGGTLDYTAAGIYALIKDIKVQSGNLTHTVNPILTRILDEMEGYARGPQAQARGTKNTGIDNLLFQAPEVITEGENTINIFMSYDYLQQNTQSVVGLLPLFSTSTPLSYTVNLSNNIIGNDPLENVLYVSKAGASISGVQGSLDIITMYRDYNSFTTTESVQPIMDGLPTINTIQIPTLSPLTANVFNAVDIKNPMKHIKTVSIVIDGKSPKHFSTAENMKGFSIDKAGNSNASWIEYSENNGGMELYWEKQRSKFGQDIFGDAGVIVTDSTTENQENVSAKRGVGSLNLSVYPAGRFKFKVGEVGTEYGITPRVVTYSVVINEGGII